jgi:hypothetical protein
MTIFDREHYFRDLLAKQVGGRTEVTLPFGRADVMTDTMVWEVEPASRYPAGVRQALQYASQTGLTAALASYGPNALVTKVFGHLARLPAPGVELWWLYERRFMPVRSAAEAQAITEQAKTGGLTPGLPDLTCEVLEKDDTAEGSTRSCDGDPVTRQPMRLCEMHLEEVNRGHGPPIPYPLPPASDRDQPNRWSAAEDLKAADELTCTLERLAWPHLSPDDRDIIAAYLIEVRSALWHTAIYQPDYAEAWNDHDWDEDNQEGSK